MRPNIASLLALPESGKNYFLKNGFFVFLEKALLVGKGVIIAYLLANYVEKHVLGAYQYVLAFLGLVPIFSLPGMGTAMVQAVARGFDGTFYTGAILSLRRAFIGTSLLSLLALYWFFTGDNSLAVAFLTIAFLGPLSVLVGFLRQYYAAKENFFLMVKVTLFVEATSLLTFTLTILFFPDLIWLLLGSVVTSTLMGLIWVIPLLRKTRNLMIESSNIEYGKRLSWSYIITIVSTHIDKVILGNALGFSQLALYTVAMIIPEQVRMTLSTIPLLLLPKFSREDGGGYGRAIAGRIFFVSGGVGICLSLAYYFSAPLIFSLFFPQYLEAIFLSQLLFLIVLSVPFLILDTYYRSQKADKIILFATIVGSIGGIGLMPIFIHFYGILGAVLARLIGYLFSGTFLAITFFVNKK